MEATTDGWRCVRSSDGRQLVLLDDELASGGRAGAPRCGSAGSPMSGWARPCCRSSPSPRDPVGRRCCPDSARQGRRSSPALRRLGRRVGGRRRGCRSERRGRLSVSTTPKEEIDLREHRPWHDHLPPESRQEGFGEAMRRPSRRLRAEDDGPRITDDQSGALREDLLELQRQILIVVDQAGIGKRRRFPLHQFGDDRRERRAASPCFLVELRTRPTGAARSFDV